MFNSIKTKSLLSHGSTFSPLNVCNWEVFCHFSAQEFNLISLNVLFLQPTVQKVIQLAKTKESSTYWPFRVWNLVILGQLCLEM